MKKKIGPLSTMLLLGLVLKANVVFAQSLPTDVKFICGSADISTKSATCALQVPADTIGTMLDISIPKGKITQINSLARGDSLPASAAFFKLEQVDTASTIEMQVDFAQLTGKAFSTTPYALIKFNVLLSTVNPADFPIIVPAPLKKDSELHTPTSLAANTAFFKGSADLPLEIRITLGDGHGTAPTTGGIGSSFTYTGAGGGGAAPTSPYCFADPIDSMTLAEWAIICEAKARGIISGNPQPDGTFLFLPNQPINRAEAVKIVTLGILRSLGKLSEADFSNEEAKIRAGFPARKFITYPDIEYGASGEPPWFAVFVNVASDQKIVHGYPHDGTYKAVNKINNAESYRVIVETGRVASETIAKVLERTTRRAGTETKDWFMKYSLALDDYKITFSKEYEKFTTRKEFLIIVMNLLKAVGL